MKLQLFGGHIESFKTSRYSPVWFFWLFSCVCVGILSTFWWGLNYLDWRKTRSCIGNSANNETVNVCNKIYIHVEKEDEEKEEVKMKKTAIVKIQMKNPVLPNFTENAMVSNFWTQLTILPRKLNFETTIMLRKFFEN